MMERPAAQRSRASQPRMPSVEDFSAITQDEMRRKASVLASEGDKGALGLLRKLAHVGMPRRDDDEQSRHSGQSSQSAHAAPQATAQRAPVARPASVPSQSPQASYDGLGRQAQPSGQPTRASEDDAMDIPAFLRRKSL